MRDRLADSRGMTIIEVLVAATILLIGIASTFAVVARGQRLGNDAQRNSQAVAIAQSEIEKIRTGSYANVGMTAVPTPTTAACTSAPTLPTDWLTTVGSAVSLKVPPNYLACPVTTDPTEPLVVCGTTGAPACANATVASAPSTVSLADGTTGKVYRFVSWRSTTTCANASSCSAPVERSSKRVTVAVALDATAARGVAKPVWTSTIMTPDTGI